LPNSSENSKPICGGQAVIEGVMMRGSRAMALAMRSPTGEIEIHQEKLGPIYQSTWAKIPFIRGLVLLWDALSLGTRVLTISANLQAEEEEEQLEGRALTLTIIASLLMAVALFFVAPTGLSRLIEGWLQVGPNWGNVLEGIIRLAILIGYLLTIARMEEVRRVFGYHGAEHKTINAFEADAELTPENVAKFPIEHPRCGTAFLLTVVVLSILLFAFLGPMAIIPRIALRILFIPLLASVAYEYLRWTARHLDSSFVRLLIVPNLALQRLTTRPPDLEMLEVAIASFEAMRKQEIELAS